MKSFIAAAIRTESRFLPGVWNIWRQRASECAAAVCAVPPSFWRR